MPIRPFWPPVRSLPLDRAVLDDEGERDGDHREIRPGDAQRRQREQRADDAGDQRRPTGNASQKLTPFSVRIAAV